MTSFVCILTQYDCNSFFIMFYSAFLSSSLVSTFVVRTSLGEVGVVFCIKNSSPELWSLFTREEEIIFNINTSIKVFFIDWCRNSIVISSFYNLGEHICCVGRLLDWVLQNRATLWLQYLSYAIINLSTLESRYIFPYSLFAFLCSVNITFILHLRTTIVHDIKQLSTSPNLGMPWRIGILKRTLPWSIDT